MSNEATPRPWFWNEQDGSMCILGPENFMEHGVLVVNRCRSCWDKAKDSEDRRPLCGYPNDADAALIVRAVNAHDGLVAALETALEVITEDYWNPVHDTWPPEMHEQAQQIEAALKAARGEA